MPKLKQLDLSNKVQSLSANAKAWVTYWRNNPINAFIGGNNTKGEVWFSLVDNKFQANFSVVPELMTCFKDMVKELVDLNLAKYADRALIEITQKTPNPTKLTTGVKLPYYPDLKIACGHFKTGNTDHQEWMDINLGNVDPERHFLARASGNSMNGGKNPIVDGDLLLLELVTPTSAGSITGNIMAIEIQDETGDNQYLLRVVQKDENGHYHLKANNPDYSIIPANDTMKTFARLKSIIAE